MRHVKSGSTIRERLDYYSVPEPNTGCLLWIGSERGKLLRYGSLRIFNKIHSAHRLSFEISYGKKIPYGLDVCHKCDTPECINPQHLFVGTRKDNMQDCIKKNRNPWMVKKDFCKRGHPFSGENLRIRYRKDRDSFERTCRECSRLNRKGLV